MGSKGSEVRSGPSLAFEAAYQIGQKQVTVELIDSIFAADLDALEGHGVQPFADNLGQPGCLQAVGK